MFKAKAIMSKDIISVNEDTSIFDAIDILIKHKITGLPVVSDEKNLVGVVTEKDVLKLLYEPKPEKDSVADYMTRDVKYFDEDDDLVQICDILVESDFRRVPILSKGKLVGIISRNDIIKFIMSIRGT